MKKSWIGLVAVLLIALALLAAGCSTSVPQPTEPMGAPSLSGGEQGPLQEMAPLPPGASAEDTSRSGLATEDTSSYASGSGSVVSRVIKTASLELKVEKGLLGEATSKLTVLAEGKGGYLQTSQFSTSEDSQQAYLVLVVPVAAFADTLKEVQKLGEVVNSETRGQDVTAEYHDLELDLTHWEAERVAALLLMDKAKTIDEIIQVRQFLEPIDRQLNEIKGRMEFLKKSSDNSTIQVTLREAGAAPIKTGKTVWDQIGDIFLRSVSFLLYILVAVLPWALLALLVLYLVIRILRRNRPPTQPPRPLQPPADPSPPVS